MRTAKMLVILVLALGLTGELAKADFTFGESVNLGSTVNSHESDTTPCISDDGLELYFTSYRSGGYGNGDIWVTTRETTQDQWGEPINLGSTVNSSSAEHGPCISTDSSELYFASGRSGGSGLLDIWVTRRATRNDDWESPVNLGVAVNSQAGEYGPDISHDGLHLYFSDYSTFRVGGFGQSDLWMTSRRTVSDAWDPPLNLGSTVNSPDKDRHPSISSDGLVLFFNSHRSGGQGGPDIWLARRATVDDEWGSPVNLGAMVNTSSRDAGPSISVDGHTLYFNSDRTGGYGDRDLYQVPINPVVDFSGDGLVDSDDMCIMINYWGTDEPLCDIGPMPWGDGIVDVQDLIVLAEHLFEEFPPVE